MLGNSKTFILGSLSFQIEKNAFTIIENKLKSNIVNYNDLKMEIINGLMPFLLEKTGRVPIILPIIMDIKNYK